ncbi:MAG TPA: terminase family protein [Gallionella sp.]|nr:terminase family protein [Gallionella sp.]
MTPAVLLPYQQRWVAEPADVSVWEKSRRIGASYCDAADSVLGAAAAENAMDALYIGYSEDMTREYIDDCAMWARAFNEAAGEMNETLFEDTDENGDTRNIKAFRIDFASGKKILALSSRPRSIRGKQGKVTIDEAAFHDDLPGLLKAALAMLIWGGKVRIISSHNGDANPFNELVNDIRAGKLPYALHRTTFDDALNDGLYERVKLIQGDRLKEKTREEWRAKIYAQYGDNAAEELDVIPSAGSGRYLTRMMVEACMQPGIPVVRLTMQDGFTLQPSFFREAEISDWCDSMLGPLLQQLDPLLDHYFGEDFARDGDLSCFWPLEQTATLDLVTPFLVELRNVPFEQQKQILFYILDRLPRFRAGAMDARGNGQYLAEVAMQKYGSRIAQVMLSQEWYRENMPPFKAAIEDKKLMLPQDADVLADLRTIVMEKGVAKVPDNARVRGSDGRDRHGDTAMALVLGTFAVLTMEPVPMEFQALPQTRFATGLGDYVG